MNNYEVFKMLEQVIMVINLNMQRLNLQLQMLHKTKCHPDNLKKKNTARVTSTLNFYRQFTNLCEQTLLAFSFMYCCFFGGFCLFVHMKEVFWGTISLLNLTSLVISGSRCYFGFQNQRNKKAPLRVQIMSAPIKRSTKKRTRFS